MPFGTDTSPQIFKFETDRMILRGTLVTFFVSQSLWLAVYVVGSMEILDNPIIIFFMGIALISSFGYLLYKLLPRNFKDSEGIQRKRNLFYYTCCIFAWSCTFGAIGTLESVVGYAYGYGEHYFEKGEPHLNSPYGIVTNAWEAIMRFPMYLIMIYKFENGLDYTKLGLYWVGDLLAGHFCFVLGAVVGKYGEKIYPSMLFNIQHIVLPLHALKYLLQLRSDKMPPTLKKMVPHSVSFWDFILFLGLMLSIMFGFLRGLAALGSPLGFVQFYVHEFEPYIMEPGKFGTVHCLIDFCYCLPVQVICAYYLMRGNGGKTAENLSLVLSGAVTQGSVAHLMAAFYHRTPQEHRITKNIKLVVLLNILPVIICHLLLRRFNTGKNPDKKES